MWTEGDLLVASSLEALPGVLGPTGQLLRSLVTAEGGPMQLTTAENLVGTWTGRWEAAEGGPEGSLGLVVARVPGREAVVGQFTFVSGAMSRTLRYEGRLENGAVRFPLVDDGRIVLEAAGGSDRTLTADRLSGTWVEHRGALPAPRGTIELERAS